jgi:hypothetical protein
MIRYLAQHLYLIADRSGKRIHQDLGIVNTVVHFSREDAPVVLVLQKMIQEGSVIFLLLLEFLISS